MKVRLMCENENKEIIKEILKAKGLEFSEDSEFIFIEKGMNIPTDKDGIFVVFDPYDLNCILRFLNSTGIKSDKPEEKTRILAKTGEKYELIPYDKIAYFVADGNNVFGKTVLNEEFKVKDKLYELEEKLDEKVFIRISKSYIVNILNVLEIVPWFAGKILLKFPNSKTEIEVSRNYVKNFKNFLGL